MIANQDEIIAKAVSTVHKLSEDELFREKCWAREDHIRQEIDRNMYYQKQLQEKDTKLQQQSSKIQQQSSKLQEQEFQLQQQAVEIERLKAQLAKSK